MTGQIAGFACFFCGTEITIDLVTENSTHYEESKGDNGSFYAETFSRYCSKCKVMLHVKFKQHRPAAMVKGKK